jgi:hypothetical protein
VSQNIITGLEFIILTDGRLRVNKNGQFFREFLTHGQGIAWKNILEGEKDTYGEEIAEKHVIALCDIRGEGAERGDQ